MNIKISQRSRSIKESPTLAITAKAAALRAQGKSIISLSAGEPDFFSVAPAKEKAIEAINDNKTLYTAVDGIPELKQAIIDKLKKDNQLDYHNKEILVSVGAKQAIFNACLALLDDGDEAVIPAPFWVSYADMVGFAGGKAVVLAAGKDDDFKITPDILRTALNDKTRMFFINSPSNPTGKIYSAAELRELGKVLADFPQVVVISDDIYEHILWQGEFASILNVCPELRDRTIIINGVSKCYAMTGWRIGYAAGNEAIIKEIKKIQSQSTSNPTSISQHAAMAALREGDKEIPAMNKAFKERHDFMADELAKIDGVEIVPADGTFYLFPWIGGLIEAMKDASGISNDIDFCSFLLEEAGVAVVPGSAFGADNYMRLSYATSMDNIKEAMVRIQGACRT